MRIRTATLLLTLVSSLSLAESEPEAPSQGHSLHGEVFNEGPRQAAVLIPGTGDVHFPISSDSAEAQQFFDQGLGQLHGFWYFEAERSFRQVAALDPNCAIAYWGMAMANLGNQERAQGLITEAKNRLEHADSREKRWIEALGAFLKDIKADEKKRRRTLTQAYENLVFDFSDDIEAKAFLMQHLYISSRKGVPLASHLTANLLLEQILSEKPNHPAHHYRIHLWDREKPARALESAAKCGPAAPAIAHMWHMPGHIYSKLHRYDDAVWQQEASARIDHSHMIRYRVIPDQISNFSHNNEWLIRNFNHLGQVPRAIELAKNMIELPRLPKLNDDDEYNHSDGSWNFGRQRLRDTLLRFEQWEQLIAFAKSDYLKPGPNSIDQNEWRRIMGIAAFESDEWDRGVILTNELNAALNLIRSRQRHAVADAKVKNADKKEADRKKAIKNAEDQFSKKVGAGEKALKELQAYKLVMDPDSDQDAAVKALEAASSMGKSRKARLLSKLGKHDKAIKLASEDEKASPNQVHPLATKAEVLWAAGKKAEASEVFQKLRTVAHSAPLQLPVFKRLDPLIQFQKLKGDWRIAKDAAKDLGDRPNLDSLGPFRWTPPTAPDWELRNSENNPVSLGEYSGKPLVVIFFLGSGCPHCIEQLNAFAPMKKSFTEAGIELIAVSTDTAEGLEETFWLDNDESKNPFPFPLVSDNSLDTFKAYRAYDDFEQRPLHGTFLIDGQSRIRWQNISFEPFMHAKFLLEESKRLLSYEDS